jgi:hypothetical protein
LDNIEELKSQLKRSEAQCEGMFVTHTDLEMKYKAKEQECETLKEEYTRVHTQLAAQEAYILVDGEEVWSGPTRKLKQENEKLKAENEEHKYKAEFYENYNNAYINKIMKLEQTLTEIKEIAEENDELLQGYQKEWANNRLILEIISEVKDE